MMLDGQFTTNRRQFGFTVLEAAVAMAVSTILFISASVLLRSATDVRVFFQNEDRAVFQASQLRATLDTLAPRSQYAVFTGGADGSPSGFTHLADTADYHSGEDGEAFALRCVQPDGSAVFLVCAAGRIVQYYVPAGSTPGAQPGLVVCEGFDSLTWSIANGYLQTTVTFRMSKINDALILVGDSVPETNADRYITQHMVHANSVF